MATTWTISVGGRSYGPFDKRQLQAFVGEGRLVRSSLVAPDGGSDFRNAGDEPELAELFTPPVPAAENSVRENGVVSPTFGRSEENTRPGERAHFVIIADMKAGSITKLEDEIFALGPAYPVLPQVWLLSCDRTINSIRNLLIRHLGKVDLLLVIDATHDKTAWFNFGPEADANIRKIWAKAQMLRAAG